MKRYFAIAVAFAILSTYSFANDKDIVVKADRFTGKTSVVMKSFGLGTFEDKTHVAGGIVSLSLAAGTTDDGRIMVLIYSTASHWQFLNGADVRILVDEKPIDLGHFRAANGHVETLGAVTTNETLGGYVDLAVLSQIANGREVAIEVGSFQARVNPKNVERLKRFTEALPAAK